MNYHKHRRILTMLLVIILIIGAVPISAAAGSSEADAGLQNVINFYQTENDGVLSDWWQLLAIYTAGEDLTDYVLPDIKALNNNSQPSDYAEVFIIELIKGNALQKTQAQELAGKQTETGSFGYQMSNQQAWAMIALDLYNRNTISEGDKVDYNISKAIEYLLTFQKDGNFFYSSDYPYPGVDYTGAVAIALAPYYGNDFWPVALDQAKFLAALKYDRLEYGSYGNAGTAAFALFGYNALGISPEDDDYKLALHELLTYQVDDGGFYAPWAGTNTSDPYYTKQAAVALAEASNVESSFLNLRKNIEQYISLDLWVQLGNQVINKTVTMPSSTTVEMVTVQTMPSGTDLTDYTYYVNGVLRDPGSTLEYGDSIKALPPGITHIASLSSNKNEVTIGQSATITLSVIPVELGGEVGLVSGASILVDGEEVKKCISNEDDKYEYIPTEAGVHQISVKWPEETTSYSSASFNIKAHSMEQAIPVSIRVEGIEGNVLYNKAFTVTGNNSLLTVYDAIIQALDDGGVPYEASGSFLSSVNGIMNDTTYTTSVYWMYTINEEKYLNGTDWVSPTTLIKENDEIIVYCGSSATYPFVASELTEGGDIKITFKSYQYDSNWNPVLQAVSDATVIWAEGTLDEYTEQTGINGIVIIPAEFASVGNYTLQIKKVDSNNVPVVIRLAPGYEISVEEGDVSGTVPDQPSDNVAKVSISVNGPNNNVIKTKSDYTFSSGMTALDLLRRTGLSIGYNDTSRTYVSSIEGYEEFDYGPTSGWLFKVNNDTSILSSAAAYKLKSGDEVVWFYTMDYTKEEGSKAWGGTPFATETVEMGSGKDAIPITYTKDGSSVVLKFDNGTLNAMLAYAAEKGTIFIDMSSVSAVDSVNISTDILKAISEKMNEEGKIGGITFQLPESTMSFDSTAVITLAEQATGASVTISSQPVNKNMLTLKQQEAIGDRPVYDITVKSGGKTISQLGGKATISIPYTLKENEQPTGIVVYHLDSSGNITAQDSTYNPATGKVTFTVNHLSYFVIGYDEKLAMWPFTDVAQDDSVNWYYSPVKFVYEHGIFSGMSATTFEPNRTMTRAMLVSVLARMTGVDITKYSTSTFNDVDASAWYASAVAWAKEAGIVSGYKNSDGTYSFRPSDVILRQDMAVMIQNFLLLQTGEGLATTKEAIAFQDEAEIASYAKTAVASMQQAGIIHGVKRGEDAFFLPRNTATRAEAAVMIWQALQNK